MAKLKYDSMNEPAATAEGAEKTATEKADDSAAGKAAGAEAGEKPKEKSAAENHSEARKVMQKRQEGERRDLHSSHRDQQRQMHDRHEKEWGDFFKAQEAEGAATTDPASGQPEIVAESQANKTAGQE